MKGDLIMGLLMKDLTSKFLEFIAKRRSANTHKFYAGRLVALDKMLGRKKLHKLKRGDMEQYLDYANTWQTTDKKGQPKAPDTVRGNIVAVEQLQKFAVKNDYLRKPIIDDIDKPAGRIRQRLPTAEEVIAIKKISPAAFNLVFDALRRCGARPGEMARLKVEHWDQVTGMITLAEHKTAVKTGQPRTIAVGEVLKEMITRSLNGRNEGPLFLTPRGKAWTTQSMSATFRRARNTLELDGEVVLYTATRHAHATAMYEKFGELATSISLGHATGMTGRYVKIPVVKRQEMQDSLAM